MDDAQFDGLVRTLQENASRRGVLGVLAGLAGLGLREATAKRRRERGKSNKRVQTAAAKTDHKVAICHRDGNGTYHRIEVAQSAVQTHLDHHGDFRFGNCCADADCPGGVPCQNGVCVPVCPVAGTVCSGEEPACGADANCSCTTAVNGAPVCRGTFRGCFECTTNDECDDVTGVPGSFCVAVAPGCCRFQLLTACVEPCPAQP